MLRNFKSDGKCMGHFPDDGEFIAGRVLLDKVTRTLSVTRCTGPTKLAKLGKKQFNIMHSQV